MSNSTIILTATLALCIGLNITINQVDANPTQLIAVSARKLASSAALQSAARTMAHKAADKADLTVPVEQTGGVRATVLHTGIDLAVDQGLDALARMYPALKVGVPVAKRLAKPALNKMHSSINNMFKKQEPKPDDDKDGPIEIAAHVKTEGEHVVLVDDNDLHDQPHKMGLFSRLKSKIMGSRGEDEEEETEEEIEDEAELDVENNKPNREINQADLEKEHKEAGIEGVKAWKAAIAKEARSSPAMVIGV